MDEGEFVEDTISQEELGELQQMIRQQAPLPEEKVGIPQLLTKIFKSRDTRKAGNVEKEDLEKMRIYLNGAEFFLQIGALKVAAYLISQSEVVSATSLSYKAAFLNAIITSKRDIALGEKKRPKKTFFGKKREGEGNV